MSTTEAASSPAVSWSSRVDEAHPPQPMTLTCQWIKNLVEREPILGILPSATSFRTLLPVAQCLSEHQQQRQANWRTDPSLLVTWKRSLSATTRYRMDTVEHTLRWAFHDQTWQPFLIGPLWGRGILTFYVGRPLDSGRIGARIYAQRTESAADI